MTMCFSWRLAAPAFRRHEMISDIVPYTAVTATAYRLAEEDGFQYPLPEHLERAHSELYDKYLADYQSWYEGEREDEEPGR
jgi:hypothetical protein